MTIPEFPLEQRPEIVCGEGVTIAPANFSSATGSPTVRLSAMKPSHGGVNNSSPEPAAEVIHK